ncbi:MAG: glycoside hydrolase family 3 protein [Rickettsiales bacterium]|nr:MAG: glycoside hydrolase family 3 protein [Rickettsiales bacterium]
MINPLIFGISGPTLTEDEINIFKTKPCVGFILFARNIQSIEQVKDLTNSLRGLYPDRFVPIFVDQEGGRVARLKPPIAEKLYPAAKYFADMYINNPEQAKEELTANYSQIMKDLKKLGIDSPCAPVCDLLYENADNIIGDRSFGSNISSVVELCKNAISAINKAGGISFIKHIPGHGRADVDSHHALPVVRAPLEDLEQTDFKVFKDLTANYFSDEIWAMTAHIIYTCIDSELPATISKKVIQYIRNNTGFKGKLVTDDIGMYALHGNIGKKRSILEQIIKLIENQKPWQDKFQTNFQELFNINLNNISNEKIIDICKQQLENTHNDFCNSLKNITKLCLEAGCDIVLHCSGNIEEIKIVYSAL